MLIDFNKRKQIKGSSMSWFSVSLVRSLDTNTRREFKFRPEEKEEEEDYCCKKKKKKKKKKKGRWNKTTEIT
jgi:hypothetical protein